ncbi:tRNA pseudouridine(38-40) synthase TruA [Lachnospiraceae bacterium OttesenSCG-928-J05]|nr:tRNA pseudouridine(38-40) synthase TruA [Lachnospiraceae bacterium OttesenSCG-928-J05]
MRNIMLTIEYDGTKYQGWSRHGNEGAFNTVSGKILEVIKKMVGRDDVELHSGVRTGVGVHAYAQVANFKTVSNLPLEDMKHYMNKYLPMDIAITSAKEVPERFHAKLNATSKTYLYHLTYGDEPGVFDRKHTAFSFKEPDKELIRSAAMKIVGKHDFHNFSSGKSHRSDLVEVYEIEVYGDDDELYILIHADEFLHNMVRIIIGTLLDIGVGNRPISDIPEIFKGSLEASAPCDPKGLFLQEITY